MDKRRSFSSESFSTFSWGGASVVVEITPVPRPSSNGPPALFEMRDNFYDIDGPLLPLNFLMSLPASLFRARWRPASLAFYPTFSCILPFQEPSSRPAEN